MTTDQQQQPLDLETDEDMRLLSRRSILRRSVLGITGVGLASLLAACGDDEEDEVPIVEDEDEDEDEEGVLEDEEVVEEEEEVEVLEISTPTT